jgi:spermidine synthase
VEKVVMVDIDGEVVEACKKFLPCHHQGAFEDSRLELIIGDAKEYLESTELKFDVMILDLCDPTDEGPAQLLYTQNFYRKTFSKLKKGGILVTQCGPASLFSAKEVFTPVTKTLQTTFPTVSPYTAFVPSFSETWAFNLCFLSSQPRLSEKEIDRRIEERISGGSHNLKHYDGATHSGMFALPKYLRTLIKDELSVVREDTLVAMSMVKRMYIRT